MRIAWSIAFMAGLATAMTGCADDPGNPGGANNPLSANDHHNLTAAGVDCDDLPTAPDSQRVDLIKPTFSNPTDADNPLFPAGELARAVLLGLQDGESFRSETTLLRGTETIYIDGKPVETLISQYVAWLDRRIEEVALDWYGQDDDGNVWYFGEDVFNYEDGVVVDTEGTWRAGVEGPVAMIMPADPQVGDVWRPENACPIVFEEVTAIATDVTVDGPSGPVDGALIVQELHMDGTLEDKTFAPGYGEFSTGSGANVEALAIAAPTDFLGGEVPEDLDDLSDGAEKMFRLARHASWRKIDTLFEEMDEDWDDYEETGVPPLLAEEMGEAIDALEEAIAARDREEARQAAVDVALAVLDFELRYEEREDIDLDLIEVWTMQLRIDVAADDKGGILSDLETIRIIHDRLEPGLAGGVEPDLNALRTAATSGNNDALESCTERLHETVAELTKLTAQ